MACSCDDIPEYAIYDYVALVKIDKLEAVDLTYNVYFQTIDQIKGPKFDYAHIFSNHPELTNFVTSCDLVINEKEEWILCATNQQGTLRVDYCSKTQLFRNNLGELQAHFIYDRNEFELFKESFHSETTKVKNGKVFTYYENGQVEIEAFYSNGQLNGERFVYYENGQLNLYQCFEKGVQIEDEIKWSKNGRIEQECHYENGRMQHGKYYNGHKINTEVIRRKNGTYEILR